MKARLFLLPILALLLTDSSLPAAVVSFTGFVTPGRPGPVLQSLPRNFTLTLNYTPTTGGSTPATGTLAFPATPNPLVANPDVNPGVAVATTGNLAIGNDSGLGGTDFITWNGTVAPGLLGPNFVNYTFTFIQPGDTVNDVTLNPDTVKDLIRGQTSIAFAGGTGGFSAPGTVVAAPEPSSMIALTGLVAGGVGFGIRRRMKRKPKGGSAPHGS
jgi:hypothetical protein